MKATRTLSRAFTNRFDINGTLTAQSLSKAHREPLRGVARGVLVAIGIALCIMPDAGGSKPVQYISYKEYALISLDYNLKEYKCLVKLYGKESAWNSKAVNGSHAGIPQGRSKWLLTATPIQQVEWGLRYIKHRYGTPCKALDHWKQFNWH